MIVRRDMAEPGKFNASATREDLAERIKGGNQIHRTF